MQSEQEATSRTSLPPPPPPPPELPPSPGPRHLPSSLASRLKRSDSLKSDQTDASSEARRVSFNTDVRVKNIPKSKLAQQQQPPRPHNPPDPSPSEFDGGPFADVRKEAPPVDAAEIASEAERILRQLRGIECSASPTPGGGSNATRPHQKQQQQQQQQMRGVGDSPLLSAGAAPSSQQQFAPPPTLPRPRAPSVPAIVSLSSKYSSSEEGDSGLQVSSGVSGGAGPGDGMQASLSSSTTTASSSNGSSGSDATARNRRGSSQDNRLFGLHALNNLDIAVNGKNVNSMPSYHEIRRSTQQLDSSGNSAEYSPPPVNKRSVVGGGGHGLISPPTKPPRTKAPSASPPSVRRSVMTTATITPHYAQPERSTKMVSSMMEQLSQDSRFRRRLAETSGDDDGMSNVTSSVYSGRPAAAAAAPNHQYLMRSGSRESPSRLSPSRTCMTDTELLRSPTEVLYAVSDKYRPHNDQVAHSASQTMHSELQQGRQAHQQPPYERRYRASRPNASREDLLAEVASSPGYSGKHHHLHASRSLDRYVDDDKENAFKARIHVTTNPGGGGRASPSHMSRKPYKTTINTANDNIIQYRGVSHDSGEARHGHQRQLYQKNQMYRRPESEHYKVPKNKAPVEFLRNGAIRHPGLIMATDSDHSSSVYHNAGNRHFASSSRMSKSADVSRTRQGELDREGRTIRRDRGRTYSGCSTSPDREGSPDRGGYSRPRPPVRSHSNLYRSPSTSPTRPPRSRSSPGRELIANVVRRVTNRGVERHPSNRATTASRSPFKDIQRTHSNVRRENSGDRVRAVSNGRINSSGNYDDSEERLARFTEYRGDEANKNLSNGGGRPAGVVRRGSSVAYDNGGRRIRVASRDEVDNDSDYLSARERGRSLPPGANIDSMRDFYKSSQFKSMYALPPSPSRPAPVLDRAPSASTLRRDHSRHAAAGRPARPTRVSISEGEVTDGREQPGTLGRRHQVRGAPQPPARRPSTKRQAPSPPGAVRRVVSSDREDRRHLGAAGGTARRVVSSDRVHPPQRRPLGARRTSMGDALDSSYSESEGFNADLEQRPWSSVSEEELEELGALPPDSYYDEDASERMAPSSLASSSLLAAARGARPLSTVTASSAGTTATIVRLRNSSPAAERPRGSVILYDKTPTASYGHVKEKPMGEFGRRWASSTHQSDIDSDYRREMATSGVGVHQEARGRDGGGGVFDTLQRRRRQRGDVSDGSPVAGGGRSSSSAREEERRKVLEIEEERLRREREVQMRRGQQVGRSGSRVSRMGSQVVGGRPVIVKTRQMSADDRDSQYSGHSSSSAMRGRDPAPAKSGSGGGGLGARFDQSRLARIKRSTSNATAPGGARREIINRKKLPGSVTSSLNSSESENAAAANGAANGQRSVFLHAACVADIPPNTTEPKRPPPSQQPQPRALSAESRDNLNQQQQPPPPSTANGSNLQKSKKISRSISMLTPWKPKGQRGGQQFSEIHYDNGNIYGQGGGTAGKPPRPPPTQRKLIPPSSSSTMQRGDLKSASSSNLLRDEQPGSAGQPVLVIEDQRMSRTLQRKPTKVSRSVSMPKDTRLAGWFKKRKRV